MKKQLLYVFLCLCTAAVLLPAVTLMASAEEAVTYIDEQGNNQTVSATQITSSTTTLSDGCWYYVSGTFTISDTVDISGFYVNLILTDGCSLTVQGCDLNSAGINMLSSSSLTIYAQSAGANMGSLSAYASSDPQCTAAGIGGGNNESCGTVTIVGGNVTAVGGTAGAGIGGGENGNGGTVNISGGNVNATGGLMGAGIGGGLWGYGGLVNISGGTVTAAGGSAGAGIGGGLYGHGGEVNISGGIVYAAGKSSAGIGGEDSAGSVNITGGTVTAISTYGSGIGGSGSGGLVRITNGTVTTTSSGTGAGIGGKKGGTVIITGGSIRAGSASGEPIGHGSSGTDSGVLTNGIERLYPVTVTLDGVSGETAVSAIISSAAYYGAADMKTDADGKLYLYLPMGATVTGVIVSGNTYTGSVAVTGSGSAGTLYIGIVIPAVTSVSLPANSTYRTGDTLVFTVNFNKPVIVTGSPYIPLTIGSSTVQAAYQSGSGSSSLVFSYTIRSGEKDLDGIGIGGSIELNSGTVKDSVGIDAAFILNGTGTTSGIMVDEKILTVTISSAVSSPTMKNLFRITITFSEPVTYFNTGSISVTNGYILYSGGLYSGGTTYTVDIYCDLSPYISENDVTVVIPEGAAFNAAGVYNSASNEFYMKVDTARPSITSVTPRNGAVNVSSTGDIVITFSEPMNTASGDVSLTQSGGSTVMLTGGTWSNENKTYTISAGTLAYGTYYLLAINNFTDLAGNAVYPSWSGGFTTEPEPIGPSVSPGSLSLYRSGTANISVALGQGTGAANLASVTVNDGTKISVIPSLLYTDGDIIVSGLAAGQAEITVTFNDSANTSKTIFVTVENAPPVWPTDSSLSASRVTQNSVNLNWTAAGSDAQMAGYKIYRDGKLIGISDAAALSYTVIGLSAFTAYSFQVQAGNADDAWSKDGPTLTVTTREADGVAPMVAGIAPTGNAESISVSGNMVITFNEEMYPSAGTVSLTPGSGTAISLAGGEWSCGNTVYTAAYDSLSYDTAYTLFAFGFQDTAGNRMSVYTCDFTTQQSSLTPFVSTGTLTVEKGGSAFLDVAMGQGAAAATFASVTVSDVNVASVNTSALTGNCSVTVLGLAAGTTDITVTFNDTVKTQATVSVTVAPAAPVWPAGSSLTASGVTQTGAVLTWTAASDVTAVTGYKIYRNGALIGTVDGFTRTYSVSGLSPFTNYYFQVQAGNSDGLWTTDGPAVSVTTKAFYFGIYPAMSSTVTAPVKGSNGTLGTVNILISGGSVSAAMGAEQGKALANGDTLELNIPSVTGADSYSVELPANDLHDNNMSGTLTVNTELGVIVIPSGMLSSLSDTLDKTAEISISRGSKSDLPDDVSAAMGDRPLVRLRLTIDGINIDWNNPDAPVTVSIPYSPTAEEDANLESIVVWYIDGAGNIMTIPNGHYDGDTGTVTFSTVHFSQYAVGYNSVAFSDVPESAWYYKAVSFIAARSITGGTSDTVFSPDAMLTRGQFITLLMRAYGIEPDENAADNFSDADSTYYTGYLAAVKRIGISYGVGDNKFEPEQAITRQQMFTLIYNALKEINRLPGADCGKTLSDFTDSDGISSYACEAMECFVKAGIVSGDDGCLLPAATTTRAQMAQIIYNLLVN